MARHEPRPVIGRNGIEAAARDDARAVGRRLRMMAVDQAPNPRRFPGDIAIMSAVADARLDQLGPIQAERPGSRGHHAGLRSQTIQCIYVLRIRNQNVRPCQIDGIQFGAVASGDGPAQAGGSELPAVLGGLSACESRGSIEHEVVFAGRGRHNAAFIVHRFKNLDFTNPFRLAVGSCRATAHRADFAPVTTRAAKPSAAPRVRRAASDMRAQALAAARRLIVDGADNVLTMRAVADAAGVTYPNLSHHFGSAAGLHAAIAEDLVRELLAGLQTLGQEMDSNGHEYRTLVARVFELFDRNGLGKVLGWLVRSGETARLKPVNELLAAFISSRSRGRSKTESKRIARVALIVAFAAYAESSVGPLLGEVLGTSPALRRQYFADALAALRDN